MISTLSVRSRRLRACAAFSLIECMMALGIVALSMLTLLALLPAGLEDLRKSAGLQADARISQTVASSYQMQSWGAAASSMTLPDKEFYFDSRGSEVKKGAVDHLYTAKASVKSAANTLSGDSGQAKHLLRLSVRISDQIQRKDAMENPLYHRERTVWVANFDQTKLGGTPET